MSNATSVNTSAMPFGGRLTRRWSWTLAANFGFTALTLAFLAAMIGLFVWQSLPIWKQAGLGHLTGERVRPARPRSPWPWKTRTRTPPCCRNGARHIASNQCRSSSGESVARGGRFCGSFASHIALGQIGQRSSLTAVQAAQKNDKSKDVQHQTELTAYPIEHGMTTAPELAKSYTALDESNFGRFGGTARAGLLTSTALNLLVLPTLALRFGKFAARKTHEL